MHKSGDLAGSMDFEAVLSQMIKNPEFGQSIPSIASLQGISEFLQCFVLHQPRSMISDFMCTIDCMKENRLDKMTIVVLERKCVIIPHLELISKCFSHDWSCPTVEVLNK